MVRVRGRHIHIATLLADTVIFGAGSFLANYLYGIATTYQNMAIYAVGGLIALVLYLLWRIFQQRDTVLRIKALETLSDTLAHSAEAYGLRNIYNMQLQADQDRRNSDTQSVISEAHNMFLCANSGASYLSAGLQRHYPRVVERLEAGVPFRVLLLDPLSDEKGLRNEINVAGEANDSKLPLGDIIRLCNDFPRLDVRFVDQGMTCSLFITENVLFFDPYHLAANNGRIENRFLCLKIAQGPVPSGESYFDLFQRHTDELWRRAVPIERWLPTHQDRLVAQLGIAKLPALAR